MKNNLIRLFTKKYYSSIAIAVVVLAACHKHDDATPVDTTPLISSFTPGVGAEGASVVITGNNFNTDPNLDTVKFNGVQATVSSPTATQLTVTVPALATTGKITVKIGSQTATSATDFTVNPTAPAVTSFTPDFGDAGSSVEITGTHFTNSSEVYFGAVKATEVTFTSATKLTAKVPATAVTGKIKVKASGLEALGATDFTVGPVLTSFAPTHGEAGSQVTLTGSHFSASAIVYLNNVAVAETDIVSRQAGQIVFKVPANNIGGSIKVTQGGADYTFTGNYTVTDIWKVTNITNASQPSNTHFGGVWFVYNSRIYVGLGGNRNFDIYDLATSLWSAGPTIPSTMDVGGGAGCEVMDGKVYISNGYDANGGGVKTLWQYDPAKTGDAAWQQMADYPTATGSSNQLHFVIGNQLFVGMGWDHNVYAYDKTNNTWNLAASFNYPTQGTYSYSFVINDVAYWGNSRQGNNTPSTDFFKATLNGSVLVNTALAPRPTTGYMAGSFAINGKGYAFTSTGEMYEYDPAANSWTQKAKSSNTSLTAYTAVVNNRAFLLDGRGNIWEYIGSY